MSYNYERVNDCLRAIDAVNPGYVSAEGLRDAVRVKLVQLLAAYGVSGPNILSRVTSVELVQLFERAKSNGNAGYEYAQLIQARYADRASSRRNVLRDPVTTPQGQSYLNDPFSMTEPQGTPAAPPSGRGDEYVTKTEFARAVATFDQRTKDDVEELRADVSKTMLKLTDAIPEALQAQLDDVVPGMVAKAVKEHLPTNVILQQPGKEPVTLGLQHCKTPHILKALAAGVNVYLHGPAGSGKTTVAKTAAAAFGLPFYFAAKVESEYMLLGFKDARGETVRTQFREAYEKGGVFLFDELDGSSPMAVVAMNAALANGICPFPDGVVVRHPDFKCIAAGNTKLGGASRQYVGRVQLDAASVDRFVFIEFDYDEALETALATDAAWCKYVQRARKAVRERELPHLITPRATFDGCTLLKAGFDPADVANMVLWKGLDSDTIEQLQRQAGALPTYEQTPATPELSIL